MTVRFRSLAFLIYVIIGIIVAWNRGYIFFAWIKTTASILLAVFLWWLVGSSYLTGLPPIRPLLPARPGPAGRPYGALASTRLPATFRDRPRRGSGLPCRARRGRGPVCPLTPLPARALYPLPFAYFPGICAAQV